MLKNIPPILSPALLKALMEMGHGDEIVISDGNFPSERVGKDAIVIRADGHGTVEMLEAMLQLFPLDAYVDSPVALMKVGKHRDVKPTIWDEYRNALASYMPNNTDIEMMERFDFYERAKKAYVIVATSEKAEFANILLKKGVIK